MKTNILKMMMLGACALVSIQVQAQDFGGKNGGDILELKFKDITNDIHAWILKGGAKALNLPSTITLENYQEKMIGALSTYPSVSFTTDKIEVNGVEKQCENIPATGVIRCNIERFPTDESDQYVLVHHEFAGIAGLEENEGSPSSKYVLSEQITGSLEKVTVLKLVVKESKPAIIQKKCAFSVENDLSFGGGYKRANQLLINYVFYNLNSANITLFKHQVNDPMKRKVNVFGNIVYTGKICKYKARYDAGNDSDYRTGRISQEIATDCSQGIDYFLDRVSEFLNTTNQCR